ncbi:MAG: hypothetical protein D6824_08655 [Planctomycetota bacterium]|nr:MAG: hypothetical protein D6824_08655 [Planctomycetota bacterium]
MAEQAEKIVRVMCPALRCRRILAVPESARGKTVRCKGCGMSVRIPPKPGAASTNKTPEEAMDAEGKPMEA